MKKNSFAQRRRTGRSYITKSSGGKGEMTAAKKAALRKAQQSSARARRRR